MFSSIRAAAGWLISRPTVAYLKNIANTLDNVHFIRKRKHWGINCNTHSRKK